MKNHRWPIITLLILAPATGELLSGSAPPAEFFNPFTFLLLTALYGSGALLIREAARRWVQGWASILLLFIFLAFIAETENAARPDNTAGMALVGLAFLGFLIGLGVKIWRRQPAARQTVSKNDALSGVRLPKSLN